jgi:uncharacterized protein YdaL
LAKKTKHSVISVTIGHRRIVLIISAMVFLLTGPSTSIASTVIYYDSDLDSGETIRLANLTFNLAGHFDAKLAEKDVATYTQGQMEEFDHVVFIGMGSKKLPHAFLEDVASGDHRVLWFGDKIEQLTVFAGEETMGFRPIEWNTSGDFHFIDYKDRLIERDSKDLSFTEVATVGNNAEVYAELATGDEGDGVPYFVCGNDTCFLADIPFYSMDNDGRYFVFADLLHIFYRTSIPEKKLAMIRLEDNAPGYSGPDHLLSLGKKLHEAGIPFSVGVIPVFEDPLGKYNNGKSNEVRLVDDPLFVQTITDLMVLGGTLIMHGITHQNGMDVSGEGWEFTNGLENVPLPENTKDWFTQRIQSGIEEFEAVGWEPLIWETPHYSASHGDYTVISEFFDFCYERPLVFPLPVGSEGNFQDSLNPMQQILPYYSPMTVFGLGALPENMGNIDLPHGVSSDSLLETADRLDIVRDGVASFFVHANVVSEQDIMTVVDGLLERGYTFVGPGEFTGIKNETPDDKTTPKEKDDDSSSTSCGF